MGVFVKPFLYVGKEFDTEEECLAYFQSKIKMTQEDLDEMGPHLAYWLEPRIKKGFPNCHHYSSFAGDEHCGFYLGYSVFDKNPKKLQEKITKAQEQWKALFKDTPQLIHAVLYT